MAELEIPDGITPFLGFRGWRLKGSDLWSLHRDVIWPITGLVTAECISPYIWDFTRGSRKQSYHAAPYRDCTCGIYALKQPLPVRRQPNEVRPWDVKAVVGIVHLWGHVIEGDGGFRVQYAKPIALVTRPKSVNLSKRIADTAEKYGIEVIDSLEPYGKM